jgi:L-amino acid N-acyltransferase YncA
MQIRLATPTDVEDMAAVHVQSWRQTYAGLMPDAVLQELSIEQRKAVWKGAIDAEKNFVYVVEDKDVGIVGVAACGPLQDDIPGYDAAIYAIYLLKSHQGQGIGRQLMQTMANQLQQAGYQSLLVWVLATNETRDFYAHMGGVPVGEKTGEVDGATLVEIAFGWQDIGQMGRQGE